MEFINVRDLLQENFKEMAKDATHLFEVEVDKDALWNCYLDSFPKGTNDVFRERREHDCSCCRQFIKAMGNVVTIKDNHIVTIWDVQTGDGTYQPVFDALSNFVRSHMVNDVFVSKFKKIGTEKNHEQLPSGKMIAWNHFYLELPDTFIDRGHKSIGDIKGGYRDTRNVFKRSLNELSVESINTVLELISQKSLYKGDEWKNVLIEFLRYKKEFDKLETETAKDNYAWEKSLKAGPAIGRIRNHSIGTLLIDISEGLDLESAVKKYEKIVAPSNYKRAKAIFTKKMLEDAKAKLAELGYMESLERRFATLDDITINNILFSNKDVAGRIAGADVFADMEKEALSLPKKYSKVEEISIDHFIENVLPMAQKLEILLENKHSDNMVSLIAPKNKDSKSMFKWNNGYSWAYTGNMTDSMLKERVKAAGGKVDGDLRFSIQWNDTSDWSRNDLDAHCKEPTGNEIYFSNCRYPSKSSLGGSLDVDITQPNNNIPAVENITWPIKNAMKPGVYRFFVHQFANRGGRDGFRAEIEFDGQIYSFDYTKELKQDEVVNVAEVTLHKDGSFTIKELLPSNVSSRDVWNLKSNHFVPVSVVMNSPNYWDEQKGIGHKHYFFMLKDCINAENPNGFYNEFLKTELYEHKRVFETLGSKMKVEDMTDQLSGVGFSSTKRADLLIKVIGTTERVLKIKF